MKIIGNAIRMTPRLRAKIRQKLRRRPGRSRTFRFGHRPEAQAFAKGVSFVADHTCTVESITYDQTMYIVRVWDECDE